MTYARARLWLGITGVGTAVVGATAMLFFRLPDHMFSNSESWSAADVPSIVAFVSGFMLLMLPFDFVGGYLLPSRHHRQEGDLSAFSLPWAQGVLVQSCLFVLTALAILAAGRIAGRAGAIAAVSMVALVYVGLQSVLARLVSSGLTLRQRESLDSVAAELQGWGFEPPQMVVFDHTDLGFTGGVVGWPSRELIIVPKSWLEQLSPAKLATALSRRVVAIELGQRTRGLLVAFAWTVIGFFLASLLPGGGVRSAAQLITTFCGFTCWSFLGLLILPTVSRQASYAIDRQVFQRGVPAPMLLETLAALDRHQDDEPERPAAIEMIFHPVPSVNNRRSGASGVIGAWHAARMTLFLSWACVGLLSRAVHCNSGRPELWVILPTD